MVLTAASGTTDPTIEILRLREAEEFVAARSELSFLPDPTEMIALSAAVAAGSDGDYSQSLVANQIDETTWELRLSTGGNTARDISTYRTDGKSVVPMFYERHVVLGRARRYVYMD